jgi:hypothetical protein
MSRAYARWVLIFSGANYHRRCSVQIALAGGLDEPVQGLQELLMADFLERLYKSTKQSRNVSKVY